MNRVIHLMDTIAAVRMSRADLAEQLEEQLAGLFTQLDEAPAEFWQTERPMVEKLRRRVAVHTVRKVAGKDRS